jgi:hypothetical protein
MIEILVVVSWWLWLFEQFLLLHLAPPFKDSLVSLPGSGPSPRIVILSLASFLLHTLQVLLLHSPLGGDLQLACITVVVLPLLGVDNGASLSAVWTAWIVTALFFDVGTFIFLLVQGGLVEGARVEITWGMKLLDFLVNYWISRTIRVLQIFLLNICSHHRGRLPCTLLLDWVRVLHQRVWRLTLTSATVFRVLDLLKYFN